MTHPDKSKSIRKVVVVGAGPTGLLLTHYLIRRGYEVALFDRRPDPRQVPANQRRSFPISLQTRGQQPLQAIPGLEAAITRCSEPCQGTILHSKKGAREIQRKETVWAIDRNQLVLALLEALTEGPAFAEGSQPSKLDVRFNCTCDHLDLDRQTITFKDSGDQRFTISYDRLVGADGANSKVRTLLAEQTNFDYEQSYVPDAYKSVFLSRINPEAGVELKPGRIHSSNLGSDIRLILAPQPIDRLHGAFVFNTNNNPLETLNTPEEVLDYFAENLPSFRPLLSYEEAGALLNRRTARLITVRCDRFHQGDRILLIGDAIHAVSPSIGQGCNAALQDVSVFNQLLERHNDSWSDAIAAFTQERRADAYALRELSDYSFPRTKLLVLEFFLRLLVIRKLHKWFPTRFQPFLFDQVLETDTDYAEILNNHKGWINKVKRSMAATASYAE